MQQPDDPVQALLELLQGMQAGGTGFFGARDFEAAFEGLDASGSGFLGLELAAKVCCCWRRRM